jgi:hypothetical protein
VEVTGSTLSGNAGGGVNATGGTVEVTGSTLSGNAGGGLSIGNAGFVVLNNFILKNGNADNVSGGVVVAGNPPGGASGGRLEHNTISENVGPTDEPSGVQCLAVTTGLTFRNNIIYGNQGSTTQVTGNCSYRYSLIGPTGVAGMGNIGDAAPGFVNPEGNMFHLLPASRGVDEGEDSDVAVDFDGDERPQGDGPDMGADEVVP